jgi:hypothetical protein
MRVEECTAVLSGVVSEAMNKDLMEDMTMEGVTQALSQMAPLKAPGLEGFPAGFFQDNWAEVRQKVFLVIKFFFSFLPILTLQSIVLLLHPRGEGSDA